MKILVALLLALASCGVNAGSSDDDAAGDDEDVCLSSDLSKNYCYAFPPNHLLEVSFYNDGDRKIEVEVFMDGSLCGFSHLTVKDCTTLVGSGGVDFIDTDTIAIDDICTSGEMKHSVCEANGL